MLTYSGLKKDVQERTKRVQRMMVEGNLGALIIVARGAPDGLGALRYLTNVHLWSGAAIGVLGAADPDPWVEIWSSYQAVWTRNETTTDPERVESPSDLVARTAQHAKAFAANERRIGMVNMDALLSVGEYTALRKALDGYQLVEVTKDYNAIRQVKTAFELEAMFQAGHIVDGSMDVFRDRARLGARYWDVCAATEAFIKGQGAFWGRTKVSLDLSPYTVPPPKDLTMKEDDIVNLEIAYECPWGYWVEMTSVFSFHELPHDVQKMLDGYLEAADSGASVARPGNPLRMISEAHDQKLRELGYPVVGKHTPDCHSIGLDGSDGSSSGYTESLDFALKANMVLSLHPGTLLANDRGFLISDNFLVTSEGGVRLSPHSARRYHLLMASG